MRALVNIDGEPRKRGQTPFSGQTRAKLRRHTSKKGSDPFFGRGFTLIEILVALAIVAVALAAGMRAVAQSSDAATLLKARTLALWVAQNRLASAQLESPWPGLGLRNGEADQAKAKFLWRETVSGTPNPAFRKIEITVSDPAQPDYALARLVGYLGQASQ